MLHFKNKHTHTRFLVTSGEVWGEGELDKHGQRHKLLAIRQVNTRGVTCNMLNIINTERESVSQLCPTLCNPMDCSAPGSRLLSMGFSRQAYWSGLPFLSPGDLPNPGIEPGSPAFQASSLPSEPPGSPN